MSEFVDKDQDVQPEPRTVNLALRAALALVASQGEGVAWGTPIARSVH